MATRPNSKGLHLKTIKMKILAFIHSWAPDGEFDNYMVELIKGFENTGAELYVINSNKLIKFSWKTKTSKNRRIDRYLKRLVEEIKPDVILSTNRGGISKSILQNFKSIPIITLMVDLTFFKGFNAEEKTFFQENDHLITPTSASVKEFEKKFPVLKGRVHYLPFCTNKNDFNHKTQKDINISFVGNLFAVSSQLIKRYKNDRELINGIFNFFREVEKNYHLDADYYVQKYNLTEKIKTIGRDSDNLFDLAASTISTNNRIKTLDSVSDLGLHIYGPKVWSKTYAFSYKLAFCHQTDKYIKTRKQLCSIYDRSKIGINVNHLQATSGIGYRVFDLLASSALPITNFQEESDLKRLFGEDHDIPTYRNPEELRQKAKYYLNHEDERRELVAYCNQLVAPDAGERATTADAGLRARRTENVRGKCKR